MTVKEQVLAMRQKNRRATASTMAKELGVTRQAVSQALQSLGLPTRIQARRKPIPEREPRFGKKLCSNVTGAMAELIVALDLLRAGFDTYRSITPSGMCDIIAIDRTTKAIVRIEVKCGARQANGRLTHGALKHNSFDVLAIVIGDAEIEYRPPLHAALRQAETL